MELTARWHLRGVRQDCYKAVAALSACLCLGVGDGYGSISIVAPAFHYRQQTVAVRRIVLCTGS